MDVLFFVFLVFWFCLCLGFFLVQAPVVGASSCFLLVPFVMVRFGDAKP